MIDKTYLAADVEDRIYAIWEAAGAFKAGRADRSSDTSAHPVDYRPHIGAIPDNSLENPVPRHCAFATLVLHHEAPQPIALRVISGTVSR